ncbi:hypothetical protein BH23ACT1_BH23ACT1_07120 [soil metagenome]
MEVDRQAPVFEAGEHLIQAGAEVVWDTLTDIGSWPRWMPGVKAVTVEGPPAVGTVFTWKAGPSTITSEILESDRPRSVGWKGRTIGIHALHVWRLEQDGDATMVVTEESWSGPLARLLRGPMGKTLKNTLDEGVVALKGEAERRGSAPNA